MSKSVVRALSVRTEPQMVLAAFALSICALFPSIGRSEETIVSHGYNFFGEL